MPNCWWMQRETILGGVSMLFCFDWWQSGLLVLVGKKGGQRDTGATVSLLYLSILMTRIENAISVIQAVHTLLCNTEGPEDQSQRDKTVLVECATKQLQLQVGKPMGCGCLHSSNIQLSSNSAVWSLQEWLILCVGRPCSMRGAFLLRPVGEIKHLKSYVQSSANEVPRLKRMLVQMQVKAMPKTLASLSTYILDTRCFILQTSLTIRKLDRAFWWQTDSFTQSSRHVIYQFAT